MNKANILTVHVSWPQTEIDFSAYVFDDENLAYDIFVDANSNFNVCERDPLHPPPRALVVLSVIGINTVIVPAGEGIIVERRPPMTEEEGGL